MFTYYNESSEKYRKAGEIATQEGFRPGSGEWWQALRYHMQFTDLSKPYQH